MTVISYMKKIYQVDAFTDQPFKGNPAGVCFPVEEMPEEWMQNVAMEMNLSETAFIRKSASGFDIRYFTPEAEIPLCGHATLASAHIMYEEGYVNRRERILFNSKAGPLEIRVENGWITMNFPAYTCEKMELPLQTGSILGLVPESLFRTGHGWVIALFRSEEELRSMNPDFRLMKNSVFGDLIATAPSSDPAFDFTVRCFAPALGIDEDPVTGSAHCALATFWNSRTGKTSFTSHQVSKREGILKVSLLNNRVEISGLARTILSAQLLV